MLLICMYGHYAIKIYNLFLIGVFFVYLSKLHEHPYLNANYYVVDHIIRCSVCFHQLYYLIAYMYEHTAKYQITTNYIYIVCVIVLTIDKTGISLAGRRKENLISGGCFITAKCL